MAHRECRGYRIAVSFDRWVICGFKRTHERQTAEARWHPSVYNEHSADCRRAANDSGDVEITRMKSNKQQESVITFAS